MKHLYIAILMLLFAGIQSICAQNSFTVVNERTGKPVEGASVYISGTSFGTVADAQGRFSLAGFPKPPYKLTVSAVGYRTQTADIPAIVPETLRILMNEAIAELQEVVVGKRLKDGWERYGQEFISNFIGYSPFAARCRILNPEVLSFFDDIENRTLRVSAGKPLLIRNDALGYTITYWLETFELNYAGRMLLVQGSSLFRDMIRPRTAGKRKEEWLRNRESAYHGSLQHFMRSLHDGTAAKQGFEVRALRRISSDSLPHFSSSAADTFFIHPPAWEVLRERFLKNARKNGDESLLRQALLVADPLVQRAKQWAADTNAVEPLRFPLRFSVTADGMMEMIELRKKAEAIMGISYEVMNASEERGRKGKVDILYQQPLRADSFVSISSTGAVLFGFDHHLHITYTVEKEEEAYLQRTGFLRKRKAAEQSSIITLNGTEQLELFPNGHFEPSRMLLVEGYWSYEKTDKLLPLEYVPAAGRVVK